MIFDVMIFIAGNVSSECGGATTHTGARRAENDASGPRRRL